MANILADEIVARHRDEMTLADIAEPVQDFGHAQGDGGLAGARIAGEGHMQRRRFGGEAEPAPHPIDDEQRANLADARLDRGEADQFAIELVENVLRVRLAQFMAQIDGFRNGGERRAIGRIFIQSHIRLRRVRVASSDVARPSCRGSRHC